MADCPLRYAYRPWLRNTRRGAWAIAIGYVATVALSSMMWGPPHHHWQLPLSALLGASVLFITAGTLALSAPEGFHAAAFASRSARVLRIMTLAGGCLYLPAIAATCAGIPAILLAVPYNQITAVLYAGALLRRVPAKRMADLGTLMAVLIGCLWPAAGILVTTGQGWPALVVLLAIVSIVAGYLLTFLYIAPKAMRSDQAAYPDR